MENRFKGSNRNQSYLLPPDIKDWLPQKHLARYIIDIVDLLDLSAIYKKYSDKHRAQAYDPKILLSLIFYGYATGIFSSRKLENATYDSVAFRYITADTHPDHDTIAHFRKRFLQELSSYFIQIISIAQETGVLKIGTISLDGTKIKANASKHKALSYKHACHLEKQFEEEVATLMKKAEEADNSSIDDGMNIPDEIALRKDRLEVIQAAKTKIEARAQERYEKENTLYKDKIKKREDSQQSGKKPKGKKPKEPIAVPKDKDQVNLTDEESRIMPTSGGGFIQAYNAQASVEHNSYLLVHNHVTQNTNDKQEIAPTLEYIKEHPQLAITNLAADAGYFSESNTKLCEENNITPYISLGKEKHNQTLEARFKESNPLPNNPTSIEKMQHRLQSDEGKALYAQRKYKIEPVFGIIKHVMGFRQFMLRGFEQAQGEWNLICIAYNLKRLYKISIG